MVLTPSAWPSMEQLSSFMSGSHFRYSCAVVRNYSLHAPSPPYKQNLALSALSWALRICPFFLHFLISGWLTGVLRGLVHSEAVSPLEALLPK